RRYKHKRRQQHSQHEDPILAYGKYLLVGTVGAFELAVFTIEHSRFPNCLSVPSRSDPVDDFFAEQTLRPEQQEHECQHVSEPDFDSAADIRPDIYLRK